MYQTLLPVVVPVLAPLVLKELKYVPAKEFAPLSQVATYQLAFDLDTDPDEYCDLGRDCSFGGVRSDIRERLLAWFMRLKCRVTVTDAEVDATTAKHKRLGVLFGQW